MLKRILILAMFALMVISASSYAQDTLAQKLSNTEVAQIINLSKEANMLQAGVKNPDLIQPGQILTFLFENGSEHQIMVEAGDNQWTIVKQKLGDLENKYGPAQNPFLVSSRDKAADAETLRTQTPLESTTWSLSTDMYKLIALGMILLSLMTLFLIYRSTKYIKNQKTNESETNPVTAGAPIIRDGIRNQAHAENVVRNYAMNNYGDSFNLREVTKGYLHAKNGDTNYANGRLTKNFRNQPGYRGIIDITGQDGNIATQVVYFLEGCGNDVRRNQSMNDSQVRFTLEPIVVDASIAGVPDADIAPRATNTSALASQNQPLAVQMDLGGKISEAIMAKCTIKLSSTETGIELLITPQRKFENPFSENSPNGTEKEILASAKS